MKHGLAKQWCDRFIRGVYRSKSPTCERGIRNDELLRSGARPGVLEVVDQFAWRLKVLASCGRISHPPLVLTLRVGDCPMHVVPVALRDARDRRDSDSQRSELTSFSLPTLRARRFDLFEFL